MYKGNLYNDERFHQIYVQKCIIIANELFSIAKIISVCEVKLQQQKKYTLEKWEPKYTHFKRNHKFDKPNLMNLSERVRERN